MNPRDSSAYWLQSITGQKKERSLLPTLLNLQKGKDNTHDALFVYLDPTTGAFHDLMLDPFLSGQECSFATDHVRRDGLMHPINIQLTKKTADGCEP
jgi:hypothetical protein